MTNHLVDGIFIAISNKAWNALGAPQKQKVKAAAQAAAHYNDENRLKEESQLVDFFKQQGVRVVNMSWGGSVKAIEDALELCNIGKTPDERKAIARDYFDIQKDALTKAFASAPEILFVTAAGNSNQDASFVEDIPADIVLPNLLTVGAVDKAGDEASFTSYGPTVRVHANGYQVESVIPGGEKLAESGTSMASPQVVNLVAKILTVNPKLMPNEVIALIRDNGCKAGLVLNPATPLAHLDHVMDKVDLILIMSVNPGFGGQAFIRGALAESWAFVWYPLILLGLWRTGREGRVLQQKSIEAKVPAGVEDGTRIRFAGLGEGGVHGGPSGDLYVILHVKEHPFFERRGADLYCTIPVSIAQAALGADLPVPGLGGEERLKIPEGTQSGAVFRIKGHGLPDPRGGGKGDLYYHVRVLTPSKLTREQRKLMEQLGATLKVENKPAERGSS